MYGHSVPLTFLVRPSWQLPFQAVRPGAASPVHSHPSSAYSDWRCFALESCTECCRWQEIRAAAALPVYQCILRHSPSLRNATTRPCVQTCTPPTQSSGRSWWRRLPGWARLPSTGAAPEPLSWFQPGSFPAFAAHATLAQCHCQHPPESLTPGQGTGNRR